MTEKEISTLAEEMADVCLIQEQLPSPKPFIDFKSTIHYKGCTYCKSFNTKKHSTVKDFSICKSCGSIFGENYLFVFPKFARNLKSHFSRFFCLSFGIRSSIPAPLPIIKEKKKRKSRAKKSTEKVVN